METQIWWYNLPGHPFVITTVNSNNECTCLFAFQKNKEIATFKPHDLYKRKGKYLGSYENDSADLWVTAVVMMKQRPFIVNKPPLDKALYFIAAIESAEDMKFRGRDWQKEIKDAYSASSSSSENLSTSNSTHKRGKQEPNDGKKAGNDKPITAKTVERILSSISSDGGRKSNVKTEKKETYKESKRDAHDREKKNLPSNDNRMVKYTTTFNDNIKREQRRHMTQPRANARKYLREESPMRQTNNDRRRQ
ncbi:uncharacterized protein EAE98_003023 [Botrytis deweyae]|uniref:Uncharacterized protein n=1 Tax=Botrytis deweyae TaxID=2478750 RepID=A0ABQ7IVG3_9HELO|nr:uncharacterized protein EAE98_003023 [Botrytis deweyae]KAF7934978.1 hypothetical protein EAE98_003023 [Botrytis deweyae]